MNLHVLGIDLGKTVFHLVGLDSTGRVVIRKRCSRTQLLAFNANSLFSEQEKRSRMRLTEVPNLKFR